jgi:polyisoprenoid-binding protein YceI
MRIACWLLVLIIAQAQQPNGFSAESFVRYEASRPGEVWLGKAPIDQLILKLDPDHLQSAQVTITIHSGSFNSGNILRDTNARRTVFDSQEFPEISFSSQRVISTSNRLLEGTEQELRLVGTLLLHGLRKPLEITVVVFREGQSLDVSGSFSIKLSDYGMSRPSLFGVLVDDRVAITFSLLDIQF